MTDYDAARAKVKKLVEKPSDDPSKLPRVCQKHRSPRMLSANPQAQAEHDEARDVFNLLNDQLITELPLFVDLRIRKSPLLVLPSMASMKLTLSLSRPVL